MSSSSTTDLKASSSIMDPSETSSSTPRPGTQEGLLSPNRLSLKDVVLDIRGEDLHVVDIRKPAKPSRNYCAPSGSNTSGSRVIPLYHVLWADIIQSEIIINFASIVNKVKCRPETLRYSLDKEHSEGELASSWVAALLRSAYGESKQAKSFKVLINPHGGPGAAPKVFAKHIEPLLKAAKCRVDVQQTTHHGHAVTIAQELDIDSFDAVACVSGDGVPHEVINGFGKRPDAVRALHNVAVVQLPGGSGNGMCWNLTGTDSPSLATLAYIKAVAAPLDLVSITQTDEPRLLSFLSQAVGIIADCDLATEHMRYLGAGRFMVGYLQRVVTEKRYPADLAVKLHTDDKAEIRSIYRRETTKIEVLRKGPRDGPLPELKYGTIDDPIPEDWVQSQHPKLGNFYSGNMCIMSKDLPFFPAATPNDGFIDVVTVNADIGLMTSLKMVSLTEQAKHINMPFNHYRKALAYRITPKEKDGYISIDGEKIPFKPFQVEIHPSLGTVLLKTNRSKYEAPSPPEP